MPGILEELQDVAFEIPPEILFFFIWPWLTPTAAAIGTRNPGVAPPPPATSKSSMSSIYCLSVQKLFLVPSTFSLVQGTGSDWNSNELLVLRVYMGRISTGPMDQRPQLRVVQ